MATSDPSIHADDGFTLIELLVSMTLSLVLLLATLAAFDAFSSASARQTNVTATNDEVRSTVDRIVGELRGAATIVRAQENDLVFSVSLSPTTTRTTRLCTPSASDGRLYESRSTTWTSAQTLPTSCPNPSDSTWSTGTVSRSVRPASAQNGLFSYDGSTTATDLTKVKSVGINLALDTSSNGRTSSSTLQASAAVRKVAGASTALSGLGSDDVVIVCPTSGPPRVSLAADVLGLLGPVTVTYSEEGGTVIGAGSSGASVALSTGLTVVVTTITDALGVTKKITKPVECN